MMYPQHKRRVRVQAVSGDGEHRQPRRSCLVSAGLPGGFYMYYDGVDCHARRSCREYIPPAHVCSNSNTHVGCKHSAQAWALSNQKCRGPCNFVEVSLPRPVLSLPGLWIPSHVGDSGRYAHRLACRLLPRTDIPLSPPEQHGTYTPHPQNNFGNPSWSRPMYV